MVRAAITYQLILAVAVGPLLCCCTAGRALAGRPANSDGPRHAGPLTPGKPVTHSCCGHKRSAPQSASDQNPAPAKPSPPAGKCPCKDSVAKAELTQPETVDSNLSTFLRALTLDTYLLFGPFPATRLAHKTDARGVGGCPGHTPSVTEELLYAHHNLRC